MSKVLSEMKEADAVSFPEGENRLRDRGYVSKCDELIVIVAMILVLTLAIAYVLRFFKGLFNLSDFCQNH